MLRLNRENHINDVNAHQSDEFYYHVSENAKHQKILEEFIRQESKDIVGFNYPGRNVGCDSSYFIICYSPQNTPEFFGESGKVTSNIISWSLP